MNFLIETKQEYTIHLVNSIYPLIYDGLQNIYEEAKKSAEKNNSNDELKLYQLLLSSVPKWNPTIIESEYQRIVRLNTLGKTIDDLLKAVIKSNIVVLTNTNIDYDDQLLKELNINDDFKTFLHLVYIECARSFYNTPFLFSHREPPIEIKRNQTEILKIIQECIKNAIRKMIPLQITIKTYLENKKNQIPTDLESESKQIKSLLKSEKIRRSELTPTSPKPFNEVIATSINSEEVKNGTSLLKNNSKLLDFGNASEKSLRDSILNLHTEENRNIFMPIKNSSSNLKGGNVQKNMPKNMSESSVYYDKNDINKKNVIEEYSNLNNLSPVNEYTSTENKEKKPNTQKPVKYFSNLNV